MSAYVIDGMPAEEAEFIRLATSPQTNVVVEACAGSGKTWLLVSRILRQLLEGSRPEAILAITFTRKAAQEMKTRLFQVLDELADGGDPEVVHALQLRGLTLEQAQRQLPVARGLRHQLLTASRPMTIQTFHGWFGQLCGLAPLTQPGAADLTGGALTERADQLLGEVWLGWLQEMGTEGELAEKFHALVKDVGLASARSVLCGFVRKRSDWWSYRNAQAEGSEQDDALAVEAALEALEALAEPYLAHTPEALLADDVWLERLGSYRRIFAAGTDSNRKRASELEMALSLTEVGQKYRALRDLFLTKKDEPRAIKSSKDLKLAAETGLGSFEALQGLHEAFCADFLAVDQAQCEAQMLAFNRLALPCAVDLLAKFQHTKAQRQLVDFSDLEWQACSLMQDEEVSAYVQAKLDARYRHILVDEFQDTNPLQWRALKAWLQAYGQDSDRPSVFLVGDPKQSIYRFRGAEPRVFQQAGEYLQAHYEARLLRTNRTRRNAQPIVDALNEVFAEGYDLYQPQSTACSFEGAVRAHLFEFEETEAQSWTGLRDALTTPVLEATVPQRLEGQAIAQAIQALIGRFEVVAHGQRRPARYDDVLVLVRRRTHLAALEEALQQVHIPFVSGRLGGLLETLEAKDIHGLLTWLVQPWDDLLLAHVLRTPLFGFSDDLLMRLAETAGVRWEDKLARLAAEGEVHCVRADRLLQSWRALTNRVPVHDLLDRIFYEAEAIPRYCAAVPSRLRAQVTANLHAMLSLALETDSGRFPSVAGFCEQINSLGNAVSQEAPDEALPAAGNAVRILTVHSAKGLEAPIVFLPDAGQQKEQHKAYSTFSEWELEAGHCACLSLVGRGRSKEAARRPMFERQEAAEAVEQLNLLYVAATRAQQLLVVTGTKPGGWLGPFLAAGPKGEWADWSAVLEASAEPTEASAAQDNTQFETTEFLPVQQASAPEVAIPQKDDVSTRMGTAFHSLLQWCKEVDKLPSADWIASRFSLEPALARQAHTAASAVLKSPECSRFFKGQAVRSADELDVFDEEGAWLRIDRFVEFGEEAWVLDYKLTLPEVLLPAYRDQILKYRRLMAQIAAPKPVRAALIDGKGRVTEVTE